MIPSKSDLTTKENIAATAIGIPTAGTLGYAGYHLLEDQIEEISKTEPVQAAASLTAPDMGTPWLQNRARQLRAEQIVGGVGGFIMGMAIGKAIQTAIYHMNR